MILLLEWLFHFSNERIVGTRCSESIRSDHDRTRNVPFKNGWVEFPWENSRITKRTYCLMWSLKSSGRLRMLLTKILDSSCWWYRCFKAAGPEKYRITAFLLIRWPSPVINDKTQSKLQLLRVKGISNQSWIWSKAGNIFTYSSLITLSGRPE